jgi:hypothetical protein
LTVGSTESKQRRSGTIDWIPSRRATCNAAANSAAAISQQIANALKGQAGLLGELEAATNAQRAAADRARAALGALL